MNIELFERVIGVMEAAPPVKLDMGTWYVEADCGTSACLAGHTVLHEGLTITERYRRLGETIALSCKRDDGTIVSIREQARLLLELTEDEADLLFDGENPSDVEYLRRLGKFIAEGHTKQETQGFRMALAEELGYASWRLAEIPDTSDHAEHIRWLRDSLSYEAVADPEETIDDVR